MESQLQKIKKEVTAAIKSVTTSKEVQDLKTKYLGRKGILTEALRKVKDLAESERPRVGRVANEIKTELEAIFSEVSSQVRSSDPKNTTVDFDTSVPGTTPQIGHLHPLTRIQYQLEDACRNMGFMVLDGPEIESDYYNFTALNIPEDHPARDSQDTFWLKGGHLLRTHTSPVQIRALQKYGAPFRGIVPGRVYRYEATDASHDHTFNQVEGLMVDEHISIGNLVATMQALLQNIFQASVDVRLRPAYFPFVEPGFELDVKWKSGKGDDDGKWLELIGCGLVHPDVLRAGNIDPEKYSGFAFGLGLTRLAMVKYQIDDIRLLMSGDLRFINQF